MSGVNADVNSNLARDYAIFEAGGRDPVAYCVESGLITGRARCGDQQAHIPRVLLGYEVLPCEDQRRPGIVIDVERYLTFFSQMRRYSLATIRFQQVHQCATPGCGARIAQRERSTQTHDQPSHGRLGRQR